jgi:uncharacterized peroxidase-related enzyme
VPHIELDPELPGIMGLMRYRPDTGQLISEMADVLLRQENTLTRGERELIAAYVSKLNQCEFCCSSHAEFAAAQLPEGMSLVRDVGEHGPKASGSPKLSALLTIAAAVTESGRNVTTEMVEAARSAGATDLEVHDTVLIAAVFCMANRYVDGLATSRPTDPGQYADYAGRIVEIGYVAAMLPG